MSRVRLPFPAFLRPVFRTLFLPGGSRTVQPIPLDTRPTGRMARVRLPFPASLPGTSVPGFFFSSGSRTVQPIPLDKRPTGRMARVRLPFPAFLRPVFRTLFLPGRPALRSRGASAARAAARGCVDSIRVFPLHSGSRPTPSESGEIGRHARLRIWCRRRKGSSPFSRMPIGGVKGRHECGNSSVVERHLAKVDVAGPTPVSRSQAESDPMSGSLFLYRPPSPAGFHPPVGLILGRA